METLPIGVWEIILRAWSGLVEDPHMVQKLLFINKKCYDFFSILATRCHKVRLQVPYITQPGTELFTKVRYSTSMFSNYGLYRMKWTHNHMWVNDILLPSQSALAYSYEVHAPHKIVPEFRFDNVRIIRTADFPLVPNVLVCDDRWGVDVTEIDRRKKRRHTTILPGGTNITLAVFHNQLISNSEKFCNSLPAAKYASYLSPTCVANGTKIASIIYAQDFSRIHKLCITEAGSSKESEIAVNVTNGLTGSMHIIKWGDKLVLDAEERSISIYDWNGVKETTFNNDVNSSHLINVDWVRSFEIWNDHLVTCGQNSIRIWEKGTYRCVNQIRDISDGETAKVVWNNLLAVAARHDILLFEWGGDVVQTLRGHNGSVRNLQYYKHFLISVGGVADRTVRVWNAKGECLVIYEVGHPPMSVLVWENTIFVTCYLAESPVYCFDWLVELEEEKRNKATEGVLVVKEHRLGYRLAPQ